MASNYQDVLDQLQAAGLIVTSLEVGGMKRCRVEGDRERRGWYSLHELQLGSGDLVLVGSFGVWRGNDNGAKKIELRRIELSDEQRAAIRRRQAEDRKRADAERQRVHRAAAQRATAAWERYAVDGESAYLARKGVGAFGIRFTSEGTAVVPLLDTAGHLHGIQFLRTAAVAEKAKRPAKEFWPAGLAKKGHFHLIGPTPTGLLLIAEGYATAATLHMATGYPVAVAFDAGNLAAVAEALRWRYKRTRMLICADDDILGKCRAKVDGQLCRAPIVLTLHPVDCPTCGQPHGYVNAGVEGASTAALAVSGAWMVPAFANPAARADAWLEQRAKPTDFNDLHQAEGLHVVRVQVEARLSALGWSVSDAPTTTPSGEGGRLTPFRSGRQLIERFALIYGHGSAAFDREEHMIVSLGDMRDACLSKHAFREWQESPDRQIVKIREVGFDPTGRDQDVTCNLFAGWPTRPKAGDCDRLLALLKYMCSFDRAPEVLYQWVLRWIAYPIQHPGAKMKSTVVVHGPQGTGKNLFFEAVMGIYGEYGDVLDQSALEDKFNDWASRKLFMIADEVVARSEAYHIKNQLKGLITGERIRINPKNQKAHSERNHVNLVFLSNELMPVVLEEDDRRHCVIRTPEKRETAYYEAVMAEIRAGGIAALHDYLLHVDLGDFNPGTLPPRTDAKDELIELGLDSPIRFHDHLVTGNIPGLEPRPALATDWYRAYGIWCGRHGYRPAPEAKFIAALKRQRDVPDGRKRYQPGSKVLGPHSFLLLGAMTPGEGEDEKLWLGASHATFREELEAFKEDK